MINEEEYYENPDIWNVNRFGDADQQRFATLGDKLPIEVRTLLDVGCGNGLFLKHLNNLKGRNIERLCGTDRSEAALAHVQLETVKADVACLPFKDNEFDAVACMEILEHLPQTTFVSALDEISRVARRYILVSVPFNENLRMSLTECPKCCCRFNPYYHLRSFRQEAMPVLFQDKGFTCKEVFFMWPQKVVPAGVEKILRLLGTAKKSVLRQPRSPMPVDAVCAACGYSSKTIKRDSSKPGIEGQRTVKTSIRSLLRVSSSWRWIGALYERG